MGYPFGKSFDYNFFPLLNNVELGAIPTQEPDVYIFGDSGQPSRAAAASGSGSLLAITEWSAITGGFKIEVPPILDPDTGSPTGNRRYWIAINFVLEEDEQVQTIIRALDMERPWSHETRVGLTSTELTTLFPEIASFATTTTINAAISLAQEECKSILLNKGYEWAQIKSPERLKLAIQARAMAQLMLNQKRQPGDNFEFNYNEYKKQYKSYLDSIRLEIDADKDGVAEAQTELFGYTVVSR